MLCSDVCGFAGIAYWRAYLMPFQSAVTSVLPIWPFAPNESSGPVSFAFGLGDILRGYFRPTNLRGIGGGTRVPIRGGKNKKGKTAHKNKIPAIPEVGDEIGKKLPGSQFFQARKVTGAERYFWIIDGYTQRALWYWMVADLTDDFITEWTTAIMESEACRRLEEGSISATRTPAQTVLAETPSAIIGWATQHEEPNGIWNALGGQITVAAGQRAIITFEAQTDSPPGSTNDGNTLLCLSSTGGGSKDLSTPWPVTTPGDDPQRTALTGYVDGPSLIQMAVIAHGTGIQHVRLAKMTCSIIHV